MNFLWHNVEGLPNFLLYLNNKSLDMVLTGIAGVATAKALVVVDRIGKDVGWIDTV